MVVRVPLVLGGSLWFTEWSFGTSSFTAGPVGLGSSLGGDFGDIASLAGSGISELLTAGKSSR
jgi:hypothetical protein